MGGNTEQTLQFLSFHLNPCRIHHKTEAKLLKLTKIIDTSVCYLRGVNEAYECSPM